MLPVATSENGSPIATFILIKTDDLLFHFFTLINFQKTLDANGY